MKSYLRRDNQACSSSIRRNQKTERGTKKTDEKSETQKRHNVRRERQRPASTIELIITAKDKAD